MQVACELQAAELTPGLSDQVGQSFVTSHTAMKTNIVKTIEHATDAQLRALATRFQWMSDYRDILQSGLPMLTRERTVIINLLKHNHIHQFAL